MRWSELISQNLPIRIDIIGKYKLLLLIRYVLICYLIVSWLLGVTTAAIVSRVLLNLKFNSILSVLTHLVLLILNIKLPYRIWIILWLVLGCRHFASFQIVFTVFRPVILICKLDHPVPIWPWGYRQVRPIVEVRRLIHLLSCIHVFGELASKLLSSRLLAALLLVIQLLICHWIIRWTYSFLDNHPAGIAASIAILSERGRVHLAPGSAGVDRMLFNYLVYSIVVTSLDHRTVLAGCNILPSAKLLQGTEIRILGCDQLGLHAIRYWLVPMVSNSRRILYTVWHDRSYSIWIHSCLCTHEVEGPR